MSEKSHNIASFILSCVIFSYENFSYEKSYFLYTSHKHWMLQFNISETLNCNIVNIVLTLKNITKTLNIRTMSARYFSYVAIQKHWFIYSISYNFQEYWIEFVVWNGNSFYFSLKNDIKKLCKASV